MHTNTSYPILEDHDSFLSMTLELADNFFLTFLIKRLKHEPFGQRAPHLSWGQCCQHFGRYSPEWRKAEALLARTLSAGVWCSPRARASPAVCPASYYSRFPVRWECERHGAADDEKDEAYRY